MSSIKIRENEYESIIRIETPSNCGEVSLSLQELKELREKISDEIDRIVELNLSNNKKVENYYNKYAYFGKGYGSAIVRVIALNKETGECYCKCDLVSGNEISFVVDKSQLEFIS